MNTIRTAALAAALLLTSGLSVNSAVAAQCQAQIDQELQRLSLPAEAIQSIRVMKRSGGAKSSSNFLYDAWIRVKSCDSGYLMITLTKGCMVQQSYTTGACKLDRVAGY
ncbi:MAG: hypothetical protein RH942_13340 [Kiloniellaceae bacterium]